MKVISKNLEVDSVTKEARKRSWIVETSPGYLIFNEPLSTLLVNLNNCLYERIGLPLKFERALFPRVVPRSYLSMYGSEFYPLDTAVQLGAYAEEGEDLILDPALTCFYGSLANKNLEDERLPWRVTEASMALGYRNEMEDELGEFSRTREFPKAEFVFVGYPSQVIEIQEQAMNIFQRTVEDWELDLNVVEKSTRHMKSGTLIEAYDFVISLGDRRVEIASTSNRKSLITQNYNIRSTDGKELWSGFLSIGLSRIVYCILAIHGFDQRDWPTITLEGHRLMLGSQRMETVGTDL